MKLGILETGQVLPPLDSFGDYTKMFRQLFSAVDPHLNLPRYRLFQGEAPRHRSECDAWLITGSAHCVLDAFEWLRNLEDFVKELHQEKRKTIGVCFGHQLIAKVCGGEVRANVGWCAGNTRYLVEHGEEDARSELRLIASHKDQVIRLPPGARLTLSAASCPIAGFSIGEHMIAIQGHPEFQPDFARALYEQRREAIGGSIFQNAMTSLRQPLDSLEVARRLVRFLRA